ncbi:hypothetical protein BaRGS_00040314, partial [Batillaria attramentaria]
SKVPCGPTIARVTITSSKQAAGWKTLKLADLIQQLFTVVEAQYRETRRACVGIGNFELSSQFLRFNIPRDVYYAKTSKQRNLH